MRVKRQEWNKKPLKKESTYFHWTSSVGHKESKNFKRPWYEYQETKVRKTLKRATTLHWTPSVGHEENEICFFESSLQASWAKIAKHLHIVPHLWVKQLKRTFQDLLAPSRDKTENLIENFHLALDLISGKKKGEEPSKNSLWVSIGKSEKFPKRILTFHYTSSVGQRREESFQDLPVSIKRQEKKNS